MQGEALAMVTYGISVLPLIKRPKVWYPDVTQTWCANDDGVVGTFTNIDLCFNLLKRFGLGHGYYPEPSKSVLIVH